MQIFNNINFLHPWCFLLLLLIPLVALLRYKRKGQYYASMKMSNIQSVKRLGSWKITLRKWLPILRALAFTALIFALARPQLTLKEENVTADGIDIFLIIDLSSSMLAQDFKPDRLEVSKKGGI